MMWLLSRRMEQQALKASRVEPQPNITLGAKRPKTGRLQYAPSCPNMIIPNQTRATLDLPEHSEVKHHDRAKYATAEMRHVSLLSSCDVYPHAKALGALSALR